MNRAAVVCMTLCAAAVLISCASTEKITRPEPIPAGELLEKIGSRISNVQFMEAEGTLTIESPAQSGTASFDLQIHRPDSIWLRMTGPFGTSVGTLMLSRERFVFYNAWEKRLVTGRPDTETMARVFNLDLSFDEITNGFLGSLRMPLLFEPNSIASIQDGQYVLRTRSDEGSGEFWIDGETSLITKSAEFDVLGKPMRIGSATRIRNTDGFAMPHLIRITLPQQKQGVTIAYRAIRINRPQKFHFSLPDGISER